jgi:hypothetical protein
MHVRLTALFCSNFVRRHTISVMIGNASFRNDRIVKESESEAMDCHTTSSMENFQKTSARLVNDSRHGFRLHPSSSYDSTLLEFRKIIISSKAHETFSRLHVLVTTLALLYHVCRLLSDG